MEYLDIYELVGDINDLTKKLVGYIGKDEDKVVVKSLTENIDLTVFDKPIEKRFAKDDNGIISDHVEMLKQEHEEWLKYLVENLYLEDELNREFMASDIKTADKLP